MTPLRISIIVALALLGGCAATQQASEAVVKAQSAAVTQVIETKVKTDDIMARAYGRAPCAVTGGAAKRAYSDAKWELWLKYLGEWCQTPSSTAESNLPALKAVISGGT